MSLCFSFFGFCGHARITCCSRGMFYNLAHMGLVWLVVPTDPTNMRSPISSIPRPQGWGKTKERQSIHQPVIVHHYCLQPLSLAQLDVINH